MSSDVRQALPVLIGTHRYEIQLSAFARTPLNQLAATLDTEGEPSEKSFEHRGIWKRMGLDFIIGAGQQYFDFDLDDAPVAIQRRRFRYSKGIDPWDRRTLKLLPNTVSKNTTSDDGAANILPAYTATTSWLYYTAGNTMKRSGDGDDSSWTTMINSGNNINSLALIGDTIYIAAGSTLRSVAVGSTSESTLGSLTPDYVAAASGRLLGFEGRSVYEIAADGSKQTGANIYDHFSTGFVWRGAVAAPNGVYCWGDSPGTKTEIYLLPVVDAAGDFTAPYPAGSLPVGETINDLEYYGGIIIAATTRGIRLYNIGGSGFLQYGALREIGNVLSVSVYGDYCYFGWSDFPDQAGVSEGFGVGRLYLGRFSFPLTPAYASDLIVDGTGRTVRACAVWNGACYFTSETGGTTTLYGAHATDKVSTGAYYTGAVTYGTPEWKSVSTVEGKWDALPSGSSIQYQVSNGISGSKINCFTNSTTSSERQKAAPASRVYAEEIEVIITINRGATTTADPKVHRWTLRALPMPFRSELIELPILLYPEVGGVAMKQTAPLDPFVEFTYLQSLVADRAVVPIEIGDEQFNAYVDAVYVDNTKSLADIDRWQPHGHQPVRWMEGVWIVQVITEEPSG
jgi:hypothetical protein